MSSSQRQTVKGVIASNFNPANPNSRQGELAGPAASGNDYGWTDSEMPPDLAQHAGANAASEPRLNNTVNATNVQGYTGAAVRGNDQVPVPDSAVTANAQPMSQQTNEWRFYQTPLMERMATQQASESNPPVGSATTPTQSQQPSGVSETTTGGRIKY